MLVVVLVLELVVVEAVAAVEVVWVALAAAGDWSGTTLTSTSSISPPSPSLWSSWHQASKNSQPMVPCYCTSLLMAPSHQHPSTPKTVSSHVLASCVRSGCCICSSVGVSDTTVIQHLFTHLQQGIQLMRKYSTFPYSSPRQVTLIYGFGKCLLT